MSKKINKASILTRLVSRFSLSRGEDAPFELSETVTPVTNVDDFVWTLEKAVVTANLSGGGSVTLFTVPVGERWHLVNLFKGVTGGTVQTYLQSPAGGSASPLTAAGTAQAILVNQNIPLEAGWSLTAYGGDGTDGAREFVIVYKKETIAGVA